MAAIDPRIVLITGCSTGIGRALAVELSRRGQRVFATARKPSAIDDLRSSMLDVLPLDVNDRASVERAVTTVIDRAGRIDMLINNAGMNAVGPLVELPLQEVRALYETNVLGLLSVTQAVFPHMAKARRGRIVNIGSVVGILPTPFGGPYCSSKAAVHMLSEVLRMEVAPFGIDVVVVQPGGVRSSISDNASHLLAHYGERFEFYRSVAAHIAARAQSSQERPMETEPFARKLCAELLRDDAPRVIRLGAGAAWLPRAAALPHAVRDAILSRRFGLHEISRMR
jgi:NAD(P)-dependent dehydrogenase (short-subunit alcohol dehydrogenase family)